MTTEAPPGAPPLIPTAPAAAAPAGVDPAEPTLQGTPQTTKGADKGAAEQREPVVLPEGWQETDEVKRFRAEGYQEAQSTLEKAHQRRLREEKALAIQERDRAVNAALSGHVVSGINGAVQRFIEKLDEQRLEPEAQARELQKLFSSNQQWAQVFNDEIAAYHQALGRDSGIEAAYNLAYSGLPKALQEELGDYVADEVNLVILEKGISREQAIERILKKRDELVRTAAIAENEGQRAKREEAEVKAAERANGVQPPVNPTGRAGGPVTSWTTKAQARTLHTQGKLTHAEMRAINRDPTIPEG